MGLFGKKKKEAESVEQIPFREEKKQKRKAVPRFRNLTFQKAKRSFREENT